MIDLSPLCGVGALPSPWKRGWGGLWWEQRLLRAWDNSAELLVSTLSPLAGVSEPYPQLTAPLLLGGGLPGPQGLGADSGGADQPVGSRVPTTEA